MTQKNLIIGIVILILIGGGAFLLIKRNPSPSQVTGVPNRASSPKASTVVSITPEGFSPPEITVKKGDTVTWLNQTSEFHWPASDLHPTHGIYPEFDPRQPISPGQSWSFTFDKVGTWRYHDHLRPIDRGIVKVIE